jgi:hypothetical protein
MFYNTQNIEFQQKYIDSLTVIGNLSNLFSDSAVPYLYYRIAEKIFCNSFNANDLSRGDIALDASKNNMGIGLKTFLKNNDKTIQKVAEFNKDRHLYENKNIYETVEIVAHLRNKRIAFAESLSNVEKSYYHCVTRSENTFFLHEEGMDYIQVENIQNIKKKKNSIWFDDGLHEYSFNISKSTLFKRFIISNYLHEFEVKIFENPLEEIQKCFLDNNKLWQVENKIIDTVYLPLYSKNKKVPEKSGLNQWNSKGRNGGLSPRDPNEVYIRIPSKVHKYSPDFFPPRDTSFNLYLPNGEILDVKVCQDNSKALMSNPNKALGKWLLRDILKLKEGELLTYERLQILGIDSIRIDKMNDEDYQINFVSFGSFEEYLDLYEE